MAMFSVKETAQLLGIGERAVQKRLAEGKLKGSQKKNQNGVLEWQIFSTNRDIREALEKTGRVDILEKPDQIASEADIVDAALAESILNVEQNEHPKGSDWQSQERDRLELVAETLMRPLVDRLTSQERVIAEKDRLIEEKDRQLRLLPDFQKQAEQERAAADLKELEAEALRKQIAAMQRERDAAEQVKQKVLQLEQALTESQRQAQEEIERTKDVHARAIEELKAADEAKLAEKEAQTAAVQEQLQSLAATVEQLKKPKPSWWQKWFPPTNA